MTCADKVAWTAEVRGRQRANHRGQCRVEMQVQRFLSKHGLASHAELLDRQGLCDDLSWLIATFEPGCALTLTLDEP